MSAAYYSFYDAIVNGSGPAMSPIDLILVDNTYTFDPAHASIATAVTPHAIGDVTIPVVPIGSLQDDAPSLGLAVDGVHTSSAEWADADTSYPVATLKAVVAAAADEPLLYLDHESFAELPTLTLGGAVDLVVAYGTLRGSDWLVAIGP